MARGGFRPGGGRPKGSFAETTKRPRASERKKRVPKVSPMDEILAAMALVAPMQSIAAGVMAGTDPLPEEPYDPDLSPMDFLLRVMRNPLERPDRRDKAAALLLPFKHAKAGEAGKKDEQKKAAATAASGKFGTPSAPPRLTVAK